MSSPPPPILKDVYNVYCDKSFFTGKNFNVNYDPKTMDNNMIPYDKLEEFHYQTSFFLNFYSSLYIELKKYEIDNNYDISIFSKTIEKLGIIIDNTTIFGTGEGKTFNLSSFPQGTGDRIEYRNFIFYNKTFEQHSSTGNHSYLYTPSVSGNTTNSNAYIKDYSEILDKSKPEFDTIYNITDINNLILIKSGNTLLTNMDILTKLNLIITDDNKTKFKEIIQEVLSQKPENILAYLLNKKIYYNIILFNIYIQKQIRINYLNYIDNTGINIVNDNKIIKFTANKNFVINNDITCKILIVGGGGGGGFNGGGGGGGGQVKYEDIRLTSGNYSIIIGNGGAGSRGFLNGSNGNISYIRKDDSSFIIEAKGGGGGGGDSGEINKSSMGTGGDIGGAGGNGENSSYQKPTSDNGGGSGGTAIGVSSGGGGGGGYTSNTNKNGKNSCISFQSGSTCSDGGFGFTITISNNESYGGGGGGGSINDSYRGGIGQDGGGNGGKVLYSDFTQATNGRVNTGGGGGGGVSRGAGGNGGSGIIILFFESDYSSFLSITEINTTYGNLIKNITDCITKIKKLNNINSDFLIEKNKYISKINILNSLTDEYNKIQDNLNISIKLYNQQYKVYNIIKKYAIYVIIALIIKIIIIFFLSIFPIFSNEIKYGIYIILLIILIIITFIYYINFKYINLYEKFYSQPPLITKSSPSQNTEFYNVISPYINKYIKAVKELLDDLRMNIYTVGSKSFSQDTNTYLYKYYLEKKKKNTNNNIKLTNLFNIIEVIKKQIIYLFNIVFIIACFIIILLISLILYLIVPYLYIYIIILCVILITILMIYFAFAIIQPTRMIANKNYWANNNPSKNTIENL